MGFAAMHLAPGEAEAWNSSSLALQRTVWRPARLPRAPNLLGVREQPLTHNRPPVYGKNPVDASVTWGILYWSRG
jgi:hypothetical protein